MQQLPEYGNAKSYPVRIETGYDKIWYGITIKKNHLFASDWRTGMVADLYCVCVLREFKTKVIKVDIIKSRRHKIFTNPVPKNQMNGLEYLFEQLESVKNRGAIKISDIFNDKRSQL